jgi:DNA repair protein RadC
MEASKHMATEITVAYINKVKASERMTVTNSSDAHAYALRGFDKDTISLQEEFIAIYLNRANQVLGIYKVGKGGITGVVADNRLVLAVALKVAAVSIIVAHNHPSGNLKPSKADEELTYKIREGAKFMDIKLLDHIIVEPSGEQYYSFADEGLL